MTGDDGYVSSLFLSCVFEKDEILQALTLITLVLLCEQYHFHFFVCATHIFDSCFMNQCEECEIAFMDLKAPNH